MLGAVARCYICEPGRDVYALPLGPTDGYRMVWALTRRKLGIAVNRKRVLRVMREQGLIQRRRAVARRRRPGFFRVERPGQLWHMDLTSIWVAGQGWCYLNAAIDCCTREIVAWSLDLRCRAEEAIDVFEAAIATSGFVPDELTVADPDEEDEERLTLGTDNGSAFTSRAFCARLAQRGVRHRRGGRDPESQAFIESWFGKLKEREVWLNEYETLEDARRAIGAYVERYHHRPHSALDYKTPLEVRQTWEDLRIEDVLVPDVVDELAGDDVRLRIRKVESQELAILGFHLLELRSGVTLSLLGVGELP